MSDVVCHSGFTYAEKPLAFWWQQKYLEISVIKTSWRTPQGRAFRVATPQGLNFELFYDEQYDEWKIFPI